MSPVIRRRTVPGATPAPAPAPAPKPATGRRRTTASAATAAPVGPSLVQVGAGVRLDVRHQQEYLPIDNITPYEWNPRDNSKAVIAVANSIRSFGFLIPIVVDVNNVLVAGHTRVEAARMLGMSEVPAIRATHLSPEQINAFRVIDNKVAEVAVWDFDLLAGEIGKLSDLGLDFTKFGWRQEEIDCLSEIVTEECLTASVDVSGEAQAAVSQRRAPVTTRVVIGELVFFLPAAQYRSWVDGIRELCNYSEEAITLELKRRLGMPVN